MREESLMASVLAAPDDPGPRLVLADWLEEQGDPRAGLIRAQLALEGLGPDAPERDALEAEEHRGIVRHARKWLVGHAQVRAVARGGRVTLVDDRAHWGLADGLPDEVWVSARTWLATWAEWRHRWPLRAVRLGESWNVGELLGSDSLGGLRALSLTVGGDADLDALAGLSFEGVRDLRVDVSGRVRRGRIRGLLRALDARSLRSLALTIGWERRATPPRLCRGRALCEELAAAGLDGLERLHLDWGALGADAARLLALPAMRSLRLETPDAERALAAIAADPRGARLQALEVVRTRPRVRPATGVEALAGIERLELQGLAVTAGQLRPLVAGGLRELSLVDALAPAGLRELLASAGDLRELALSAMRSPVWSVSRGTLEPLMDGAFPRLRSLELSCVAPDSWDDLTRAICRMKAPRLAQLRTSRGPGRLAEADVEVLLAAPFEWLRLLYAPLGYSQWRRLRARWPDLVSG